MTVVWIALGYVLVWGVFAGIAVHDWCSKNPSDLIDWFDSLAQVIIFAGAWPVTFIMYAVYQILNEEDNK